MKKYSLVRGMGRHQTLLNSFDLSLINAGLGDYNLIKISSILPGNVSKLQNIQELSYKLKKGDPIFIAYSTIDSRKHSFLCTGVAVGIPEDKEDSGIIMEYSSFGENLDILEYKAKENLEFMIIEAFKYRKKILKHIEFKIITGQKFLSENTFLTLFTGVCII